MCPLEADHDQVSPVVPSELGGASVVDECTPSLGGMEAPEPLVVARIPSVNVPVCVVSRCVFTSVAKCVLQCTHSVGERLCVRKTACVEEIASVSEKVCVTETPCMKEAPCEEETPRVKGTACVSKKVCVSGRPCASGTTCASKMACVSERPCARETACMSSLYVREMTVGMREHTTACPSTSVMVRYVSVVTRRSACVEWG